LSAQDDLLAAERRLQAAQLAGDVAALDELIDDRLVFTGPDGKLYRKQDDLHVHRTGHQVMTHVDEEELEALVDGDLGVTWFLGRLAGTFGGEAFDWRMRYTRTWHHNADGSWKIVAAHGSAV
jgi:ketosteroid isomerase-like protein